MDRLTWENEAGVRLTIYSYYDTPDQVTHQVRVDVTSDRDSYNDHLLHSRKEYDGLGRQTASTVYTDAFTTQASRTVTQYNGLGQVWTVSNPEISTDLTRVSIT